MNLAREQHFLRTLVPIAFEATLALASERARDVSANSVDVTARMVARALVHILAKGTHTSVARTARAREGSIGVAAVSMRVAVVGARLALIDVDTGPVLHLVASFASAVVAIGSSFTHGVVAAWRVVARAHCLLALLSVSLVPFIAGAGVAPLSVRARSVLAACVHISLALVNVHAVLPRLAVAVLALALV